MMAYKLFLVILLISLSIFGVTFSEAQLVPAMYIFGDSLVDVGNNNHLKLSFSKADYHPYGVDFPNHIPTGRFSNGKNAADFLGKLIKISSLNVLVMQASSCEKKHGNLN